ncbi:MAG TPA: response regulator [Candidatus Limnocylindria bacterium]|nr:response regulator [Candidatus Limnocylindria bacterium]
MADLKMAKRRVVVVVEDDRPIGELLASIINEEPGYYAIHVTGPLDALATVREVRPDLLVLDVNLPGMNGLELYDKIRQDVKLRGIPVLFETALSKEYRGEFKRRGIDAVLEKPFDVSELVERMHQLAPVRLN